MRDFPHQLHHRRSRKGQAWENPLLGMILLVIVLVVLIAIAVPIFSRSKKAADCQGRCDTSGTGCLSGEVQQGFCDASAVAGVQGKLSACCVKQSQATSAGGSGGPGIGPGTGGGPVVDPNICGVQNADGTYANAGSFCSSDGTKVCSDLGPNPGTCIPRCDYCTYVGSSTTICDERITGSYSCHQTLNNACLDSQNCIKGYCPSANPPAFCAPVQVTLQVRDGEIGIVNDQTPAASIAPFPVDYGTLQFSVSVGNVAPQGRTCSIALFKKDTHTWLRKIAADNQNPGNDADGSKSFRTVFPCGKDSVYHPSPAPGFSITTAFDTYFKNSNGQDNLEAQIIVYSPSCSESSLTSFNICQLAPENQVASITLPLHLRGISPTPVSLCPVSSCEGFANLFPADPAKIAQACANPQNPPAYDCSLKCTMTGQFACTNCPNTATVTGVSARETYCEKFDQSTCATAANSCGLSNLCAWKPSSGASTSHCGSAS